MSSSRSLLVLKFGGTALGTPMRIRRAAKRVAFLKANRHDVVVVVSALGQTTDSLIGLTERAIGHTPSPRSDRERDRILATGEDLAASLLAAAINEQHHAARSLRGGEAGLIGRGAHGGAALADLDRTPLQQLLDTRVIPVVSGFQAVRQDDHETVTLGRGTSDLTAVFLASRLCANECHLIKDVDGVFDADPNRCTNALRHDTLSYEALESIAVASEIVHAEAAALARSSGVRLRIYGYSAPFRVTQAHGTTVGAVA